MRTKRFRLVREVVEWDSDLAYPAYLEVSDDHCRAVARDILGKRPGWKLVETDTRADTSRKGEG